MRERALSQSEAKVGRAETNKNLASQPMVGRRTQMHFLMNYFMNKYLKFDIFWQFN